MKKILPALGICLLMAGCSNAGGDKAASQQAIDSGTLIGTLAGNDYESRVACYNFGKDYFQFQSDATNQKASEDTTLLISGMQSDGKLVLSVVDDGKIVQAGTLDGYKVNGRTLTAFGSLSDPWRPKARNVQLSVTCS